MSPYSLMVRDGFMHDTCRQSSKRLQAAAAAAAGARTHNKRITRGVKRWLSWITQASTLVKCLWNHMSTTFIVVLFMLLAFVYLCGCAEQT